MKIHRKKTQNDEAKLEDKSIRSAINRFAFSGFKIEKLISVNHLATLEALINKKAYSLIRDCVLIN